MIIVKTKQSALTEFTTFEKANEVKKSEVRTEN